MIGLPIAVALGALIGKSEYQLEVLKDLTPATLERGKQYLAGDHITIQLKQGECDKLYIEAICETAGNHATAIIEGGHTTIVFEERNGEVITDPVEAYASFAKTYAKTTDPRMVFLIIAIVCVLLDIAVRKFKFKWPHEILRDRRELKQLAGERSDAENTGKGGKTE